jgi:phage replication-related protein YjqB (UPF0714/DUF867 family)
MMTAFTDVWPAERLLQGGYNALGHTTTATDIDIIATCRYVINSHGGRIGRGVSALLNVTKEKMSRGMEAWLQCLLTFDNM